MPKLPKFLLLPIVAASLVTLVWADVRPWRAASAELADNLQTAISRAVKNDLETDIGRYTTCQKIDVNLSQAWRDCTMDAMSKARTMMGALAGSASASLWLSTHPDDAAFKQSALVAIQAGRAELVRSKPYLERYKKALEAHDQSFFMKLIDGRFSGHDEFDRWASKLDEAEFAVRMPDVALKQRQWRESTNSRG